MKRALVALGAALLAPTAALGACDPDAFGPQPAPTDVPTALGSLAPPIVGAPETEPGVDASSSRPRLLVDGGEDAAAPPPLPEPFEADTIPPRELVVRRELPGMTLTAQWRGRDVPAAPSGPQVNDEAIAAARELTTGGWRVQLAADGHMRVSMAARAQPLPQGTALLGRWDRYGTLVVWPDGSLYRVVVAGALRATLGERRADSSPLSAGRPQPIGEGDRLGLHTRKVELRSSMGGVRLELAETAEAGLGGPLLCRLLVELAAVDPATSACLESEVALAAEYFWGSGDGGPPPVVFEVTALTRHTDLSLEASFTPPEGAIYTRSGLPGARQGAFFRGDELAAFRRAAAPGAASGDELTVAANHSDLTMYLVIDGVPVVAVEPWREALVPGLLRGKYVLQWRSFFGEVIGETAERDLPARVVHGQPDAAESPDAGR